MRNGKIHGISQSGIHLLPNLRYIILIRARIVKIAMDLPRLFPGNDRADPCTLFGIFTRTGNHTDILPHILRGQGIHTGILPSFTTDAVPPRSSLRSQRNTGTALPSGDETTAFSGVPTTSCPSI